MIPPAFLQLVPDGNANLTPALLALEDGSVFRGTSIGVDGQAVGEVVFNTAMTGYQEILTDPSYAGQIVTLTYPHIGNTGTNAEDVESDRVWAAGLVIRDLPILASSWRMQMTLAQFLAAERVVAIAEIDTRRLTRSDPHERRAVGLHRERCDRLDAKARLRRRANSRDSKALISRPK